MFEAPFARLLAEPFARFNGVEGYALPHTGLLAYIVGGVDSIGKPISEIYAAVPVEHQSIYSANGIDWYDWPTIIANIAASEFLNNGGELAGNGTKGYVQYIDGTTEAVLRRVYGYFPISIDETPAAFTFTDATGAELSTPTESDAITVSGITFSVPFTVSGGQAEKNDSGVWTTSGTVIATDTVKVRATSSNQYETAVGVVLDINGVSDTFTITTRAEITIGDISALRILSSGYQAEIDIVGFVVGGAPAFGLGANNNPSTAKITLTVTSPGYNDSCALGTVQRTVYGTIAQRKAYPNQAQKEESATDGTLTVRFDLSEYIHDNDTVTASISSGFYTDSGSGGTSLGSLSATGVAVTNSSTVDYPVPIANWTCMSRDVVGSSLKVSALAFQKYGQEQRPVRAVKFIATDESANSVSAIATSMAVDSAMSSDAIPFPEFFTTLDITSLAEDQEITVQAEVYPWVGNADSVAISATTGITESGWKLRPIKYFKDTNASHGYAIAVVDPVNGSNTTGTAAADLSGADTAKCASLYYAVKKIRDYNNTNFGRANCSGGTIYLVAGSHNTMGGAVSTTITGTFKVPLTIKPYPGLTKSDVTLVPNGTIGDKNVASTITRFVDLTFSRSANVSWLAGAAGRIVQFDNCALADTGDYTAAPMDSFKNEYKWCAFTKTGETAGLLRGCTVTNSAALPYLTFFCGNSYVGKTSVAAICRESIAPTTDNVIGAILAYNKGMNMPNSVAVLLSRAYSYTQGVAIVCNMFEMVSASSSEAMMIGASATAGSSSNHVIFWHNTIPGRRGIYAYNEVGLAPHVNWSIKYNILDYLANKGDTFSNNSDYIGGWPIAFGVGCHGNVVGDAAFEQEFAGIHSVANVTRDNTGFKFVDYKAGNGGAGNGDYHLQSDSPGFGRIPAGEAVLPCGLDLVAYENDGTGSAGAYQYTEV